MKQLVPAILTCVLACHVFAYAADGEALHGAPLAPAQTGLVERFLSNTNGALTSYRAFRTLEAETRGGKMRARLTAWTTLDPVQGFQYSIVEENGSSLVRERVLHAALEAERDVRAKGEMDRSALSASNYEFGVDHGPENGLVRVAIHPKRHDAMLIEGSILLTDPEGDLARVEGFLIKKPSFWTREVQVVRHYERIDGIRVPVSMQSTARVVIAGRSTFSMVYEYESINGLPVAKGPPSR